jgi:hypothetical protein
LVRLLIVKIEWKCKTCMSTRRREIDKHLLLGMPSSKVAKASGLSEKSIDGHRRRHLPWRPQNFRVASSVGEQLEDLKFEAQRLQALGECGESVSHALAALRERRAILELEARMGGQLDATHQKLLHGAKDPAGGTDYEVVFVNGRPKTVEKPA